MTFFVHPYQIALLLASLLCMIPVVVIIGLARKPDAWQRRARWLSLAGLSGFCAGACLGAMVAVGRSVGVVVVSAGALGTIMALAALTVVLQALWLFERDRRRVDSTQAAPDGDPGTRS